jgi:hypothetical protein
MSTVRTVPRFIKPDAHLNLQEDNLYLVAHTALKILDTCLWYLDSRCSKNMTGDKTLLKEV